MRVALSGPVRARVERDGRDLLLILPGARAAAGLVLPEPVARSSRSPLDEAREGARIRHPAGERAALRAEPRNGGAREPDHPCRPRRRAAVAPPPRRVAPRTSGTCTRRSSLRRSERRPDVPRPPSPSETTRRDPRRPTEGACSFGPIRLRALRDHQLHRRATPLSSTPRRPVRDRYFQIEPRLAVSTSATPPPGTARFQLSYTPRFRVNPDYVRGAEQADAPRDGRRSTRPSVPSSTLRAAHHYAQRVLETTEVDPGREYFFQLAPFTTAPDPARDVTVNSGGLLSLDLDCHARLRRHRRRGQGSSTTARTRSARP